MRGSSDDGRRRLLAVGALALAALVCLAVLVGPFGDRPYTVRAQFTDTGLLVPGNSVRIAGRTVGSVADVRLTDRSVPEVELELDAGVAPLREGTEAHIRLPSLSSPAGRYIHLSIPPAGGADIPDGGLIPVERTEALVSVDQVFNMFDDRARRGLRRVVRGFGTQFDGTSEDLDGGYRMLDPAVVASRRLFDELNRDTPALRGFLQNTARLVSTLAGRREDLSALVDRLATATGAIAREADDLSAAIARAPDFMRRANTTYVNLRSTLDDLDPLIAAGERVAPRLDAVLAQLRPFAAEAGPTVRSLSRAVLRAGPVNDLTDIARLSPRLRDIALRRASRNGEVRRGSFAEVRDALRGITPQLAFFRPYSPDITGFLKALGQVGIYDANGQASRAAVLPGAFMIGPGGAGVPLPQQLRQAQWDTVAIKQRNRCPGSAERPAADGSNPWRPGPGFNCDPSQVPPGP